jgi:hypothetical protein
MLDMCDVSAKEIFEAWEDGVHIAGITSKQYISILEEHTATPDRGLVCIRCKHLPRICPKSHPPSYRK